MGHNTMTNNIPDVPNTMWRSSTMSCTKGRSNTICPTRFRSNTMDLRPSTMNCSKGNASMIPANKKMRTRLQNRRRTRPGTMNMTASSSP